MGKKVFIVFTSVAIFAVAAALAIFYIPRASADTVAGQKNRIDECMSRPDAIPCTRTIIRELLKKDSAADVLDAVAANFTALRCHYIGHIIGQEQYLESKDAETALSRCSQKCDASCIHGAIGEAFAEELGLGSPDDDQNFDLQHLSAQEITTLGKTLCKTPDTCHAIGHALFQSTRKVPDAMASCAKIGTDSTTTACFGGAMMEYADILVSRSMRDVPDVTYPAADSLDKVCDLPLLVERRSCFRYFSRVAIETLTAQGLTEQQSYKRLRSICKSFANDDDRDACFYGYGRSNSYMISNDGDAARYWCTGLQNDRDEAACYFGETSTAARDRVVELVNFCGTLRTDTLKSACYQELANYFYREGESSEDAAKLCKSDDTHCAESFQKGSTDPWILIQANFRRYP